MRKLLFVFLLCIPMFLSAKVKQLDNTKHEIRVGWGDYLFESLVYHDNRDKRDYRYTGHIFAEYQYQVNDWFSAGMQFDYERVWWNQYREGIVTLNTPTPHHYDNMCFMPAFRFTYFYNPVVTLFSAIYVGLNINTGDEINYKNQRTAVGFDWGATLLGVKVGYKGLFGCVEVGGLSCLNNMHEIYMLDSRIFSASVGYRF